MLLQACQKIKTSNIEVKDQKYHQACWCKLKRYQKIFNEERNFLIGHFYGKKSFRDRLDVLVVYAYYDCIPTMLRRISKKKSENFVSP